VIVHFVDIGEMVDHHCLSFPFIRHQFGNSGHGLGQAQILVGVKSLNG
jgi:hypothetical protein